jgi:hypothetical protein
VKRHPKTAISEKQPLGANRAAVCLKVGDVLMEEVLELFVGKHLLDEAEDGWAIVIVVLAEI